VARKIFRQVLRAVAGPIAAQIDKIVPFAFDVSGETEFRNTSSNTTFAHYRAWLQNRYNNSVARLSAAWALPLTSFDDVDTVPSSILDPSVALPQWIDWNLFNTLRVKNWLAWMRAQIQGSDPSALVLAYPASPLLWGIYTRRPVSSFGLDWVGIARVLDVLGTDTRVAPGSCDGSRSGQAGGCDVIFPEHNGSAFDINFLPGAATYDFLRSVAPGKALINPEWHSVASQTDPFQVGVSALVNTSREFMSAATWLAYLHGASAQYLWYWGRTNTGAYSPRGETSRADMFYGSFTTQPQLLDSLARTKVQLDDFADDIVALVSRPRSVLLLYSTVCSIADLHHLRLLLSAYESLYSLDVMTGFLPDDDLCETTLPEIVNWASWIIVPSNQLISNCAMTRLRDISKAGTAGPHVLLFGTAATLNGTFRLDARGQQRDVATRNWVSTVPTVVLPKGRSSIGPSVMHTLDNTLSEGSRYSTEPRVRCVDTSTPSRLLIFGMFCKSVGSTVFVINLRNVSVTVGLDGQLQIDPQAAPSNINHLVLYDAWRLSAINGTRGVELPGLAVAIYQVKGNASKSTLSDDNNAALKSDEVAADRMVLVGRQSLTAQATSHKRHGGLYVATVHKRNVVRLSLKVDDLGSAASLHNSTDGIQPHFPAEARPRSAPPRAPHQHIPYFGSHFVVLEAENLTTAAANVFSKLNSPARVAVRQGWRPRAWGAGNYFAASGSNTFHSRRAHLHAPAATVTSMASATIVIPQTGVFSVLARYEALYRFDSAFRVLIHQDGQLKFDRVYGLRSSLKIWAYVSERLAGSAQLPVPGVPWIAHHSVILLENTSDLNPELAVLTMYLVVRY
jgi:hypothetical protein